ncbi:hypothetical protein DXX94_05420 [Thalassotalea euphylliae]|uniref:Uncharacterized protein n=1 Tax=Thalassotalea euphylliae TaxID=1655234 RepID=A0A3E0TZU3_9GAMM|nr:hypothetical protein DXX94_05420 [Thalassotalea euphylliae]
MNEVTPELLQTRIAEIYFRFNFIAYANADKCGKVIAALFTYNSSGHKVSQKLLLNLKLVYRYLKSPFDIINNHLGI